MCMATKLWLHIATLNRKNKSPHVVFRKNVLSKQKKIKWVHLHKKFQHMYIYLYGYEFTKGLGCSELASHALCVLTIPSTCVLQCVAVCCSGLPRVAACCSVLQCVAVGCSVLQRVAVCCSMLQCVAVCCSVLHRVAVCCGVLQSVAVCSSVTQCFAVCCSVLQCRI